MTKVGKYVLSDILHTAVILGLSLVYDSLYGLAFDGFSSSVCYIIVLFYWRRIMVQYVQEMDKVQKYFKKYDIDLSRRIL